MADKEHLIIKNMVCPRCIQAVRMILTDLGIPFSDVSLGKVVVKSELEPDQYLNLASALEREGFELLEEPNARLVNAIKQTLIQQIHHRSAPLNVNFSTFLAEKFHHDYAYLSRLFSAVEGVTIEKYIIRLRVEKVKELLTYEELTLTQIADALDYSSVSHLSSQFKKETGMTPSDFKALLNPPRSPLDAL